MKRSIKLLILTLSVLTSGFTLTACNTMSGLGKDIQGGGKALSKAASSGKSNNGSDKQIQA